MTTPNEGVPDYASLVSAVHEAEAASDVDRARTSYDALLRDFPLCYGYWKRFADFEVSAVAAAAAGTTDELNEEGVARANAVYERALVLGKFCVEIWAYYGAHATARWQKPEDVRALFERGASLVGSDYGAENFWDRYIAFETGRAGDDYARVSSCYRRILQLPLRSLDALWLRFQQLAVERSCAEILDDKEEATLQQQLEAAGLAPHRPPSTENEDDGARKLRLLPLLEAQFRRSKADHADRLRWEGGVTRRHFHLKPLDEACVAHWHSYIDWEEARGNVPRLILTYERCLVPCCMDAQMWLRYVRTLESRGMIDEARDAFGRCAPLARPYRPMGARPSIQAARAQLHPSPLLTPPLPLLTSSRLFRPACTCVLPPLQSEWPLPPAALQRGARPCCLRGGASRRRGGAATLRCRRRAATSRARGCARSGEPRAAGR